MANYEIGLKGCFFDNRLSLATAAFQMNYIGLQLGFSEVVPNPRSRRAGPNRPKVKADDFIEPIGSNVRVNIPPMSPAALLLIDVQQGFDHPKWGARNNPGAEQQIAVLLDTWRKLKWPVIHVQHMSQDPGSPLHRDAPGNTFKSEAAPDNGEQVFQKTVNSAFIGTTLEAHLRAEGIRTLVVAGLTTDHCVSTTVRMAGNLGFEVIVVEDATATFERTGPDGVCYSAEQMHRLALASLHGEFAQVLSTGDVPA